MQLLVLAVIVLAIPDGTFLYTAPPTNGDLGVGLLLHPLLGVAPRPNDQPEEVETLQGVTQNQGLIKVYCL